MQMRAKRTDAKVDIRQAMASYETWLRGCTKVVDSALKAKHEQMRSDPFLFFRGTYYRWTQVFPQACSNRTHFSLGARIASVSGASAHLRSPSAAQRFALIHLVLPTSHLFDHD